MQNFITRDYWKKQIINNSNITLYYCLSRFAQNVI